MGVFWIFYTLILIFGLYIFFKSEQWHCFTCGPVLEYIYTKFGINFCHYVQRAPTNPY